MSTVPAEHSLSDAELLIFFFLRHCPNFHPVKSSDAQVKAQSFTLNLLFFPKLIPIQQILCKHYKFYIKLSVLW